MSAVKASIFVDPKLCAAKSHIETGLWPVKDFNLPSDILANQEGELKFRLDFGRNDEKLIYIEGRMEANLNLCCQRCLQILPHYLNAHFKLSPVRTEEEALNLPAELDAVWMTGNKLSILNVLEEELILNLPLSPLHEVEGGECIKLQKDSKR